MINQGFAVLPKSATSSRIASNIQLKGITLSEQDYADITELGRKHNFPIEWKATAWP